MKFGIFDHVDASGLPLQELYEGRLKLTELYDRYDFHCYHIAEHHFTPLGLAPSPSILMAAVAQRTKRIRMGPLIYLMPLYHPLRLLEEVCMLDHLSGGRFQLGIGRGVSPFEMGYYGAKADETAGMYHEAYQILMQGFSQDELSFVGKYYQYDKVPMVMKPLQKPHPPLWYGAGTPDAAAWCAQNNVNIVTIGLTAKIRALSNAYRDAWQAAGHAAADMPLIGVSRHIVVADTDEKANEIARRAYPLWRNNLAYLWKRHNADLTSLGAVYPLSWDECMATGAVCAGSPETVLRYVKEQSDAAGVNYFCSWFQFGDMTLQESQRSVALFAERVLPAFAKDAAC